MITKGNLEKLQNEVIAQILTGDAAKGLNSPDYYQKRNLIMTVNTTHISIRQ